jgi:hypothetical protein
MVTHDIPVSQGFECHWLMTCSDPGAPDGATRPVWGDRPSAIGHPGPEPWLPGTGAEGAVAEVTEQVQAARSQGAGLSLTAMHIQCT